MTGILPN